MPSRARANAQTPSGDNARVSWARKCDPAKILAGQSESRSCIIVLKTEKKHSKMGRNKVKLRIGNLLDAISSFIVLVEDAFHFWLNVESRFIR